MPYSTDWHAEGHSRCRPSALKAAPTTQTIPLYELGVVLHHNNQHLRASECDRIFDGERYNRLRCLREIVTAGGGRSAFWHPHEEFVGQGYWRGPYGGEA